MSARPDLSAPSAALRPRTVIGAVSDDDRGCELVARQLAAMADTDRVRLISAIADEPDGLPALIAVRHPARTGRRDDPGLGPVEAALREELTARLAPEILRFEAIGRDAPESVLRWLIDCESVHPIENRDDLRRRLHPVDRGCFALCHPALGDQPIVFVEVALTAGLAPSVQAVLDPDAPVLDPGLADTATFYSINSCHPGLKGIRFGGELLHRVMDHLSATTSVTRFSTLSPIPGFADWLADRRVDDPSTLLDQCARYLLTAKDDDRPLDPVARFHLGRGARLERLNPCGDTSPRGRQRSHGITANYVYEPARVAENQAAYRRGEIVAAPAVRELLTEP